MQAIKENRDLNSNFIPLISEAEMNALQAFIDFVKGLLRIDKDTRWTPLMAKEHPFITREVFTGPFEPQREQEKVSTTETTGEDTMRGGAAAAGGAGGGGGGGGPAGGRD